MNTSKKTAPRFETIDSQNNVSSETKTIVTVQHSCPQQVSPRNQKKLSQISPQHIQEQILQQEIKTHRKSHNQRSIIPLTKKLQQYALKCSSTQSDINLIYQKAQRQSIKFSNLLQPLHQQKNEMQGILNGDTDGLQMTLIKVLFEKDLLLSEIDSRENESKYEFECHNEGQEEQRKLNEKLKALNEKIQKEQKNIDKLKLTQSTLRQELKFEKQINLDPTLHQKKILEKQYDNKCELLTHKKMPAIGELTKQLGELNSTQDRLEAEYESKIAQETIVEQQKLERLRQKLNDLSIKRLQVNNLLNLEAQRKQKLAKQIDSKQQSLEKLQIIHQSVLQESIVVQMFSEKVNKCVPTATSLKKLDNQVFFQRQINASLNQKLTKLKLREDDLKSANDQLYLAVQKYRQSENGSTQRRRVMENMELEENLHQKEEILTKRQSKTVKVSKEEYMRDQLKQRQFVKSPLDWKIQLFRERKENQGFKSSGNTNNLHQESKIALQSLPKKTLWKSKKDQIQTAYTFYSNTSNRQDNQQDQIEELRNRLMRKFQCKQETVRHRDQHPVTIAP